MNTIKTFLNNATKAPGEERESYGFSGTSDDVKSSTSAQKAETAGPTEPNDITESYSSAKQEIVTGKDKDISLQNAHNRKLEAKVESSDEVTYDKEVTPLAPKVHERVHRTIVDENQREITRDHHVDHYVQKIQPIAVSEFRETSNAAGTDLTLEQEIDNSHDEEARNAMAKQDAAIQDTAEEDVHHERIDKEDIVHDKTHHHIHERIQPVLEKDIYEKEVRHNKETVKATIHDKDVIDATEVLPTKFVKEEEMDTLEP